MPQSIRRPGRTSTNRTRHAPRKRGLAKPARRAAPRARFAARICPHSAPLLPGGSVPRVRAGSGSLFQTYPDACAGLECEGTRRPLLVRFSPRDAICGYMRTYRRPRGRASLDLQPARRLLSLPIYGGVCLFRGPDRRPLLQPPTSTQGRAWGTMNGPSLHRLCGCVTRRTLASRCPKLILFCSRSLSMVTPSLVCVIHTTLKTRRSLPIRQSVCFLSVQIPAFELALS